MHSTFHWHTVSWNCFAVCVAVLLQCVVAVCCCSVCCSIPPSIDTQFHDTVLQCVLQYCCSVLLQCVVAVWVAVFHLPLTHSFMYTCVFCSTHIRRFVVMHTYTYSSIHTYILTCKHPCIYTVDSIYIYARKEWLCCVCDITRVYGWHDWYIHPSCSVCCSVCCSLCCSVCCIVCCSVCCSVLAIRLWVT